MLLMALNLTQGESCREQGPEWRKGLSSCWGCLRSWGEGTLELGWRAGDRLPQPSSALAGGCREWGVQRVGVAESGDVGREGLEESSGLGLGPGLGLELGRRRWGQGRDGGLLLIVSAAPWREG